ncbi:uncharacterized protein K452DRAFT_35394 [Aplosporella prunicola CBS 121167]|uniref:Secreted protein n=1 Tax=Aplosporella prunicola CBS 121167 TaxID=1176127 RepID=A0A6A6ATH9_9PEZI|nr:uncharacterized protein K452DRAFT_35394 [Aplosporella prunicola CBS 121167]KAF2135312.1 hypothetical protein K452DRAFT_35394 [Aplosporella prunicola CBS 121167]
MALQFGVHRERCGGGLMLQYYLLPSLLLLLVPPDGTTTTYNTYVGCVCVCVCATDGCGVPGAGTRRRRAEIRDARIVARLEGESLRSEGFGNGLRRSSLWRQLGCLEWGIACLLGCLKGRERERGRLRRATRPFWLSSLFSAAAAAAATDRCHEQCAWPNYLRREARTHSTHAAGMVVDDTLQVPTYLVRPLLGKGGHD